LLTRLQDVISSWKEGCEVHCFGSFAAGLYLPNADMDVAVVSQEFKLHGGPKICRWYGEMQTLAIFLEDEGIAEPKSIEIVPKAKVPLIKFVDRLTSLKVDMSFENLTGVAANETFRSWEEQYPAMPIIVVIIKQFLMMRGLNEVVNGGLGGFSITCLVTSLLQNMPRVKTKEFTPELHLGEILLEFLDLYGNQFDISRTGIRMQPPGYFDKVSTLKLMRKSVNR
jgi:non-canonical poly(A) RNA polymerase PAPD5/7